MNQVIKWIVVAILMLHWLIHVMGAEQEGDLLRYGSIRPFRMA